MSNEITQDNAEAAADYIRDHAGEFAQAKANRVQLEAFIKSKRAILMQSAPGESSAAKEMNALAHPEYIELLDALKEAVMTEEKLKWLFTAAELKVDIWRTQEANSRRA